MHALIYSRKAEATRRFFRDTLGFRAVDAGHGWLVFSMPPTELAVHPAEDGERHELYLMCDDIDATISELGAKGVVTRPIQEESWGRVTRMRLPSGEELGLYEPKHPTAIPRPG
jgi:catechol 2,3-dioxygenase-like lactoylglutathione lyase family enzyme